VYTRGELCPVPELFGIPLLIYSPAIIAIGIDGDNQPAVYLRILPKDGMAPARCVRFHITLVLISTRILNTDGKFAPQARYANGRILET
jgi:hypothetical protein